MRIGHLEIFVRDPAAARRFYEEGLGFEFTAEQGADFVWLKSGGLEVLLRRGQPPTAPDNYHASAAALVLYSDDLAAAQERLAAAGVPVEPMENEPDCVVFQDPDGNWLQLVNPSGQ
ncbi:MAG: VOC family protein [Chloroflexi bacterium]|nr:VOC family protein [Chloroflexota bacterium]